MATLQSAQASVSRSGINPKTGQPWRLSDSDVKAETRAEIEKMKRDPKLAAQFLQELGVVTRSGHLARRYGGR